MNALEPWREVWKALAPGAIRQSPHEYRGIHREAKIHFEIEAIELLDFRWVNIEHDQLRSPRKAGRWGTCRLRVQAGADRNNQVSILDSEVCISRTVRAESAYCQRVIVRHQ